jgi:hypothetical protein
MPNDRNATHMQMQNATASVLEQIPPPRKATARVALVRLPDVARLILTDCFRQFGMEIIVLQADVIQRLKREKFEACVLSLGAGADEIMQVARSSPSNSRMVIYGVGGKVRESLRLSQYCVNAVFNEPLERPSALKLVRATQMLVTHEFRRYVRLPVCTEVSVVLGDKRRFSATSLEISSGGMSLQGPEALTVGQTLEISFALLTLPRLWVRGSVSWRKPANKSFGVRFDPKDDRRLKIKEWVDGYLEN